LLMQLREQVKNGEITSQTIINPLPIRDFSLYGREISPISKDGEYYLANHSSSLEDEVASSYLNSNSVDSDSILINVPEHEIHSNAESSLAVNLEKDLVEQSQLEFDTVF